MMNRKQLLALIGCAVVAMALLVSLFALSPIGEPIVRQPFSRNFDQRIHLTKAAEVDLGLNSFYIAGTTKNTIYLGNFTAPLYLQKVSLPKLDTQHQILKVKGSNMLRDQERFRLAVDSPYFYLTNGVTAEVYKGSLINGDAKNFLPGNSPYFTEAIPINPNLFALKSHNTQTNSTELAALRPDSPYFEFKPDVLVKQVDGVFCVDGKLQYDKETDKLVYVHYYRNEYIVIDTNLNVLNRFHTIDTFSRAAIKIADVESKNYRTLASPPVNTNSKSWVSGKLLFIQSPLLAANEDIQSRRNRIVIDTYDIDEGKYLYSFYLDLMNSKIPLSLTITPGYIAVIFDQQLIVYRHNLIQEFRF